MIYPIDSKKLNKMKAKVIMLESHLEGGISSYKRQMEGGNFMGEGRGGNGCVSESGVERDRTEGQRTIRMNTNLQLPGVEVGGISLSLNFL